MLLPSPLPLSLVFIFLSTVIYTLISALIEPSTLSPSSTLFCYNVPISYPLVFVSPPHLHPPLTVLLQYQFFFVSCIFDILLHLPLCRFIITRLASWSFLLLLDLSLSAIALWSCVPASYFLPETHPHSRHCPIFYYFSSFAIMVTRRVLFPIEFLRVPCQLEPGSLPRSRRTCGLDQCISSRCSVDVTYC
jgi:hypothetical protein